jgi:hypothetical protein
MQRKLLLGMSICFLAGSLFLTAPASAAPGTPASLEFGYGARIDSGGLYVAASIRLAAHMQMDWVALDFDWNSIQSAPGLWNEASSFSNAILLARSLGLGALVSVKNAPAWAMTARGPDAEATATLVSSLANSYPNLHAVELFPEANTISGWGAAPDAAAYASVYNTVQARLDADRLDVYLVAGGLLNTLTAPDDVRDVDFLEALYRAGLRPAIVGIRLQTLAGQPLDAPSPVSLRHYEDIRVVMTANGHAEGLVWITNFALPEQSTTDDWLVQAYELMQAQLYLGAAFYAPLNPPAGGLVGMDGMLQPPCFALSAVIGAKKGVAISLEPSVTAGRVKWMVRK